MSRRGNPYTIIGKNNEHEVTTANELMVNADLDWTVSLEDTYAIVKDDQLLSVPNRYATVRTNTDGTQSVLTVVGSRYKVFQNNEIFSALDDVVGTGQARYGAAGELKDGSIVWTVLELPDNVSIGDDPHSAYIIARTSHDGSTPFQMTPVINRIGCTNQINAAMMSGKKKGIYYRVKHSPNSVISSEDIKKAFKVMHEDINQYTVVSTWLRGTEFSNQEFTNFIKMVYPLASKIEFSPEDMLSAGEKRAKGLAMKNRDNAISVWMGETDTQHNIKGTKFGAFQAIVETSDHFSRSYTKQCEKMMLSTDLRVKAKALQLLGVNNGS